MSEMDHDYQEAARLAPPEPSIARPQTIVEDARRWRQYWLDWYAKPTVAHD